MRIILAVGSNKTRRHVVELGTRPVLGGTQTYEVVEAETLDEGWKLSKQNKFDEIIFGEDISMAFALQFCKLAENHYRHIVPAILVTSDSTRVEPDDQKYLKTLTLPHTGARIQQAVIDAIK